jgi:hypothetical protein
MPRNTQSNRGGNNRSRRSNNNNPEGYNQFSSGWRDTARERPIATAAAAAAAVGASVFLWSRRNQISEQLSNISDQLGEWTENMASDNEFETVGGASGFTSPGTVEAGGDFATGTYDSEAGAAGAGTSGRNRS